MGFLYFKNRRDKPGNHRLVNQPSEIGKISETYVKDQVNIHLPRQRLLTEVSLALNSWQMPWWGAVQLIECTCTWVGCLTGILGQSIGFMITQTDTSFHLDSFKDLNLNAVLGFDLLSPDRQSQWFSGSLLAYVPSYSEILSLHTVWLLTHMYNSRLSVDRVETAHRVHTQEWTGFSTICSPSCSWP